MNTLTPLEYFAAHAPPPADWFEPEFKEVHPPPLPDGVQWCEGCKIGSECYTPEVCAKMREWLRVRDNVIEETQHGYARAKASQWPWVWAKMVLEENPETKAQTRYWTPELAEELLAACKSLLMNSCPPIGHEKGQRFAEGYRMAQAAIAKAEGNSIRA